MEEQPKPAPRRTATKSRTATKNPAAAKNPAKATPAKAAPGPKAPAKKRTPAKNPTEVSTSDIAPVVPAVAPRIRDLIARLGPDARDWVARTRERYPAATAAAVSRLAASQRRETAWLMLAVAAAYGLDPTSPARATDLRELAIHSGRSGLEGRARAHYSQETWLRSNV